MYINHIHFPSAFFDLLLELSCPVWTGQGGVEGEIRLRNKCCGSRGLATASASGEHGDDSRSRRPGEHAGQHAVIHLTGGLMVVVVPGEGVGLPVAGEEGAHFVGIDRAGFPGFLKCCVFGLPELVGMVFEEPFQLGISFRTATEILRIVLPADEISTEFADSALAACFFPRGNFYGDFNCREILMRRCGGPAGPAHRRDRPTSLSVATSWRRGVREMSGEDLADVTFKLRVSLGQAA